MSGRSREEPLWDEMLSPVTIARLNAEDRNGFVAAAGSVFERSPWIAEAAWERRPFRDFEDLLAKMCAVVEEASPDAKLELIRAHPDLGGRLAREGRLTAASGEEQRAAGLEHLSEIEKATFDTLNTRYRERFGFPFVICARQQTKISILSALAKRAQNEQKVEVERALSEIEKIARLRLAGIVTG